MMRKTSLIFGLLLVFNQSYGYVIENKSEFQVLVKPFSYLDDDIITTLTKMTEDQKVQGTQLLDPNSTLEVSLEVKEGNITRKYPYLIALKNGFSTDNDSISLFRPAVVTILDDDAKVLINSNKKVQLIYTSCAQRNKVRLRSLGKIKICGDQNAQLESDYNFMNWAISVMSDRKSGERKLKRKRSLSANDIAGIL
jgi:hypothetical protein